jgi:membrane protein
MKIFSTCKLAIHCALDDFMNNHGMALAAGLSYYFVLSLFPLLIALSCVVPYLPIPNLWDKLLFAMSRVVPGEAMGLVQKVVTDVLAQTHPKLLSVGILGTLYAATGGFSSMIEALNVANDVPETRPWWRTRLLAVGLTFLIGAFFVIALAVMVVGPQFGGWLAAKVGLGSVFANIWNYLRWGVAIAFTVIGVELLYFMAPNVKQRFWATLPGATLAVAGWIAASYGLGIYFQKFANFNKTYGTLGAVVALFVWFYWTNIFILFGAELNSEMRKAAGKKPLPVKEAVVPLDLPKAA